MFDIIFDFGLINALVLFCALIFVHELGHFLAARANGVKVEVFSIGFGPELFGWHDRKGTRWRIAAVPMGGYVKMWGEEATSLEKGDKPNDSEGETKPDPNFQAPNFQAPNFQESFAHKSISARAVIIAAGPFANFLFAALIYIGLFIWVGQTVPGRLAHEGVGFVDPNGAAAAAGLQTGDRLLAVNGAEINDFQTLIDAVKASAGQPLDFDVMRADKSFSLAIAPRQIGSDGNGQAIYQLGIGAPKPAYQSVGVFTAIGEGFKETWRITAAILAALWETISGQRSVDDLGGPVRILQMSGEISSIGLVAFLSFAAVLSINLGLINLLPIPVLDGGHLVFLGLEAVRGGKPINDHIREWALRIGVVFVLGLMILVTIKDIFAIFG